MEATVNVMTVIVIHQKIAAMVIIQLICTKPKRIIVHHDHRNHTDEIEIIEIIHHRRLHHHPMAAEKNQQLAKVVVVA